MNASVSVQIAGVVPTVTALLHAGDWLLKLLVTSTIVGLSL